MAVVPRPSKLRVRPSIRRTNTQHATVTIASATSAPCGSSASTQLFVLSTKH
ncbi:UNVERIFIED_CONTAM: hypothetical protein GTU68_026147 [Idotea baltica]|nr:hypothetical protein [Idotea baltica]